MNWTTQADLKTQLMRLWDRGELLRALLDGGATFPLRLALKGPGSTELSDRFDEVREWAARLAAVPHVRIEWREVRHRVQGRQRLPAQVWVDSLDSAFALLSTGRDAERFLQLERLTRDAAPALLPWLARRPLQAIDLADAWARLLAVVRWCVDHPRAGIYLRQVDIPGVNSKFIERHREVLAGLLDLALPADAIDPERTGTSHFAARYGFRGKSMRIRFRVLDERIVLLAGTTRPDIALDAESFGRLELPVKRAFVTENEINFLAFPPAADAVVIFGAGYGWDALAQARWLADCDLHYWGDIDTHGFAILDQLRGRFGHARSFLMDRETLMAHEEHWGEEADRAVHDLPRLTPDERALFDDLRDNRIRRNLRLEQERVSFACVTKAVTRLIAAGAGSL